MSENSKQAWKNRETFLFQTVTTVVGSLPYIIVLNLMCFAMWRFLKHEPGFNDSKRPKFSTSILDLLHSPKKWPMLALCAVAPWYFVGVAYGRLQQKEQNKESIDYKYCVTVIPLLAMMFCSAVVLMAVESVKEGFLSVGFAVLLVFAVYCCRIRSQIRNYFHIEGDGEQPKFINFYWCLQQRTWT